MASKFTSEELEYLRSRPLGRLATVDSNGAPQVVPVGFVLDGDGQVLIGGTAMGKTRKFRNVRADPRVAFVVDDVPSTDPWQVRGVEIRGSAEALDDFEPPHGGLSREVIRITPISVRGWGLDEPAP